VLPVGGKTVCDTATGDYQLQLSLVLTLQIHFSAKQRHDGDVHSFLHKTNHQTNGGNVLSVCGVYAALRSFCAWVCAV